MKNQNKPIDIEAADSLFSDSNYSFQKNEIKYKLQKEDHFIFPICARNNEALKELTSKYRSFIQDKKNDFPRILSNVLYSSVLYKSRLAILASSREELLKKMEALEENILVKGASIGTTKSDNPTIVFAYTGMGPEWWNMGRELMKTEPVFYKTIKECDVEYKKISGWSILEELQKPEKISKIKETYIAQPANFVIQIALTRLLENYGVSPDAVVGHSLGEGAATYVSGALSLKEALSVIFHRSRLECVSPIAGSMLAVGISEVEAKETIQGYNDVSIAAINSPTSVTLVGSEESLQKLEEVYKNMEVFYSLLAVPAPYHSPMMSPIKSELLESLKDLDGKKTKIDFYSTVTGDKISGKKLDNHYWWRNVSQPVRFTEAMESLARDKHTVFIEIGPHPVLKNYIKECLGNDTAYSLLETLNRKTTEQLSFFENIATLFTLGFKLNWEKWIAKLPYMELPSNPLRKEYDGEDFLFSNEQYNKEHKNIDISLYTPPKTEIECRLAKIWRKHFDLEKVGTEANFYFLGGTSIEMAKLARKIEEEFGIIIDVRRLFTCIDFVDQVKLIESSKQKSLNHVRKAQIKSSYPLFTTQKRLYALYESDPQSLAYNIPVVLDIKESLDIKKCEDVFREIINRHEALRTSFEVSNGVPVQKIHNDFNFHIEIISDGDSKDLIKKYIKPFNLSNPPLLRVIACKEGNKITKLILDVHHIVLDGASLEVLLREFNQLYSNKPIEPLTFQYKDFIEWNNEKINNLDLVSQKEFWMNQYAELVEPINLPVDEQNKENGIFDGDSVIFSLTKEEEDKLRELCKKEKVTMSSVTLAIFYVLLSRLTNSDDIVIGTSSIGRWNKEFKDLIGLFIDALPIRSNPSGNLKFSEFLQNIKINVLNCIENGDYSFEELHKELRLENNSNSNSLYNIAFEYYNFDWGNIESSDLHLSIDTIEDNLVSKFPLVLRIVEREQGCEFLLEYSFNSFNRETVERFSKYYKEIVKAIIKDDSVLLKDIQILPEVEVSQQLNEFNNTNLPYEKDKTIIEIFSSQVEKNPDKVALIFEEESLTYKELDNRSTQLARYITKKVKAETSLIGLCVDNSINMIVGVLGILKSGRGYVPIDSLYSNNTITDIIKDSNLELVIVEGVDSDVFKEVNTILLDADKCEIEKESIRKVSPRTNYGDLACCIYGSTEKLKGVLIDHKNIINLVKGDIELSLKSTDSVLQWYNLTSRESLFNIFGSILNGATLYIKEVDFNSDLNSLTAFIKENEINIALFTTSVFNRLVENDISSLKSLRKLFFGGERASTKHVQRAYDVLGPNKMINYYGFIEGTVCATYYTINERPIQSVPIGKPISNTKAYVLDSFNNLCGIGVTGDLYIEGDCLSTGYLRDAEKTNSRIIKNLFGTELSLFKTDDLAKWSPNGNLEFVDRKDRRIKFNGAKVNLSEIELQLANFNEVKGSIVLVKEIEGEEYLVLYYTSKEVVETSKLKDYLSKYLPEFMIPSLFVHLTDFPLTSNGKINLEMLPEPTEVKETEILFIAPSNEIEHKLVAIWAEVLSIDPEIISINGNFFDYGGYSLNVLFLISRINKEFDIKVSPSDVIENPTIANMQNFILTSSTIDHVSIPVAEIRTYYPLSSSQKRMYYTYEYDKDSIAYNAPIVFTLEGELDKEKLKTALEKLIQRHENFRTVFEFNEGELMQRIIPEVEFDIDIIEGKGDMSATLEQFLKPFNLNESPSFRVGLKCISNTEYVLVIDIHHIVSDGITTEMLLKDFIALYNTENLTPCRIQYKDFAIWEQKEEYQKELMIHKEYWLEKFAKETTTLELPYDYPRPKEFQVLGKNHAIELNSDYANKLKSITQSEGVTMYTLILALYNLLLYKLSNQKDIVIGTSVAGRSHIDLEFIAGNFINTLALRNELEGELTFKEFLQQVKNTSSKDLEHQLYPYDDLVKELNVDRFSGRSTLFEVFLAYQAIKEDNTSSTSELEIKLYKDLFPSAQFDLILTVLSFEEKLKLNFTYRDELFKEDTVVRFMSYLKRIIDQVLNDDTILIDDINILSQEELHLQLNVFNDTELSFDKKSSLVSIFEENVALHPDRIAISYKGEVLTYRELDEESNKIANYLVSEGVVPNVVGLLIDRSIDMIIGMWGALKVGAGYLPLDPNLPEERIRYMLNQSSATFLLTHEEHLEAYSAYLPVQSIDSLEIFSQSIERVDFNTEPTDLAYCIFTSGSTGKPKGVMISHSNVINLVKGLEERVYKSYKDKLLRVALLASYAFDASVQQIFGTLLQGHSLYIANDDTRKDGAKLLTFYNKNKIDLTDGTPTHLRLLLDSLEKNSKLETLSSWLIAGETLSKELVSKFYINLGEQTQLYNFYGPTETCVDSTSYKINPKEIENLTNIPIGKPLANERVYVTDSNGALVPIGVIGELCIAGEGLAKRYVGNQSMTTEKFNAEWISHENRVYRTGDMVKWLPDGNLEFHGRKDNQVKIRGYRIELGEIEKQLNTHSSINHSVVLVKESGGESFLVAYYQSSYKMKVSELRSYLGKFLPDYMIPSYFVFVESFGLTVNGKVDHRILPDYKIVQDGEEVIEPSNEIERKLALIYEDILNINTNIVGRNSNFIELGGHSLKMVYLANTIKKEFSVKVSLKQIIENPTVNKLSNLISESVNVNHFQIPVSEPREYYPLSSSQKRMYFAYQYNKELLSYNVPTAITLNGNLDIEKLKNSFVKLINRHDSLRTEFVIVNGEISQRILSEVNFSITDIVYDKDIERTVKNFIRPFNLSKGPLLRVGVVEVSNQEHLLIIDSHHIISDEVTSNIILKDLFSIYDGDKLPELRIQYKDFVMWQNQNEQQEEIKQHKKYWSDKFLKIPPVLELPYDYPRAITNSDKGGNFLKRIDETKVKQLKKIARNEGVTLYNLFLSMYNILLYKLSNQQDIVVGTPVAGRSHQDLESVTGVFINTLPIRNQIKGEIIFEEFLQQVQKGSIIDLDHQLCPYEDLVNELNIERSLNRNPLFDVSFNFINQDFEAINISELRIKPCDIEFNQSKFDLNMIVVERKEDNFILVEYAKQLFKESTIERFMNYFDKIIEAVCKNKTVKITDIEILEEKENQLLNSFNPMVNTNKENDTIVKVFENQVNKTPLAVALKYGEKSYNYQDLNQKVNQLARNLQQNFEISKGEIVGVLLPKSDEAIISILAILKLGATYLPIDIKYPLERINYIIENSGLRVLINNTKVLDKKVVADCVVNYDTLNYINEELTNLNTSIASNDLAYVIYTSGSTGKPKGVMIEHGSNVNMSTDIVKQLNVNDRDTILWFASIAFDASVYEVMMALYSGATLVIPEDKDINDITRFCKLATETNTTIVTLPPSYLETLPLDELDTLRIITTAGEAANSKKAIEVIKTGIRYFNAYGPTECAVCTSIYEVFRGDAGLTNIPIGKPIANTEMVILDKDLKQVPIGVKGMIYIAGKGLARGYVNNAELTSKSFITISYNGIDKRFYNTGDIGEWTENGLIVFHGRKDNQVKLRGHRIELGEIEGTLSTIKGVRNNHVVVKEVGGNKELVVFFVADEGINETKIEDELSKLIPEYMIPKSWIKLDEFPLTINGKIDTMKLLQLDVRDSGNYVAPSNDVEEKLTQIWSEILPVDKSEISVLDDFFDLGGNSLIAIQLLTAINKNYGIQLELQEVFKLKTISGLSELIGIELWVNNNEKKGVEYNETVI